MKQRLASVVFVAAVIVGWAGVWIAQYNAPARETGPLQTLKAAELQGVKRVVFDVKTSYQWQYSRPTLVLAGWSGDMRLQTAREMKNSSTPLLLVREGDTVFVRMAESPSNADQKKKPFIALDRPVSLTLPASITELTWPQVHLLMASAADMPSLSIRARELNVGATARNDILWETLSDAEVHADLRSDAAQGKLGTLTAHLLPTDPCFHDPRKGEKYSDDFSYKGGIFGQITVLSADAQIAIHTMEPDLQLALKTSPDAMLKLRRIAYLERVQVQTLTTAQADELKQIKSSLWPACEQPNGS
ncbi:hypothetical protein [Diaphorobacter aerolatus]|uniref:Uncharacterized protein n=1 Tax=Diaphorobacter aerolatus TaxID=1288495 RepID=A0A7H0GIG0_9BURK|nr:hypothetical protein [Diaphorobacter aerolatus]QNP48076.1 hypothetical protein H9K75_18690 [Diaphorobacter aerolatus]